MVSVFGSAHLASSGRSRRPSRRIGAEPRAAIAALLATLLASGCAVSSEPGPLELGQDTSLYALVSTTDGFYFYPPLAPAPVYAGTFDDAALAHLAVLLEATDGAGVTQTVATFTSATNPRLQLLSQFSVYYVGVPAAAYFTNPALAYRFRVTYDGRELGRSDLSSRVFDVLQSVPQLVVGVKLRVEVQPSCTDARCNDGNACNGLETCQNGACVSGTPLTCSASGPCTVASCDPAVGCVEAPAADGPFAGTVPTTCGRGVCAATGSTVCSNGQVVDTCTPGQGAAADTSCNGADDDCDGAIDEDYVSLTTTCGSGDSAATGHTSCVGGRVIDDCVPAPTCTDGVRNGSETGVDCGGSCGACPIACSGAAPGGTCTTAGCSAAIAANGTTVSVTTAANGQAVPFEACGTAGQRWSFTSRHSATCNRVTVTSPTGVVLVNNVLYCGTGFTDTFTLPTSGAYTINVAPSSSVVGTVSLTLWDVPADATAVGTLGAPRAPTLAATTPGQNATLYFDGTAGTRTSINVARTSGCYYFTLTAPSGATVINQTLSCGTYFTDLVTLQETGRYAVRLDPNSSDTMTFTPDLYVVPEDLVSTGVVGGAAVTQALLTPAQNGYVRFAGAPGQRISFLVSRTAGCFSVSLTAPNGARPLAPTLSCGTYFSELVTLDQSGTYSLLIDPNSSDTATFTTTLYAVPADAAASATLGGASVSFTLGTPAQNGTITFPGTAGQRTSFLVSRTAGCFRFSLTAPSGATAIAATLSCGTYFSELYTLTQTGNYTITIDPNSSDTATFTTTLYEVPADLTVPAVIGGGGVVAAVTTPAQNAYVTFSGAAGQRMTVNVTRNTGCYRRSLTAPSGATVISSALACGTFTSATLTLAESGTFTLFLDPNSSDVPTFTTTLSAVP